MKPLVKTVLVPTIYVVSINETVREKTNNLGSDQVRHKLGYTVTEDNYGLEILDVESRGIVLSAHLFSSTCMQIVGFPMRQLK